MTGAWQLKTLKGPVDLYTRKAVDIIKNIETGQEYVRGEWKLFEKAKNYQPLPPLVENDSKFQLINTESSIASKLTTEDYAKEIFVSTLLKR